MVLEAFGQALQGFLTADLWLALGIGVIVGLVFGIIPGVGSLIGVILFLPFVFYLTPEQALPLMVALTAAAFTGGSITAILLGIPGDAPNAATVIDGYPMTQKGEGGRALGAALTASGLGGLITVFFALAMISLVLPMITGLTSGDLVFVVLIGIAFIGILGRGSMLKGLISGGLGLIVSFVGFQVTTGVPRFTFGITYLYEGLHLIPVGLGLFAIPEMVVLAAKGGTIASGGIVMRGMQGVWQGVKDVFRHFWLFLRSSVIGYIIGIIPGAGSVTAVFVAYGQAKASSKHPEKFGTGTVEGVIAPESANNSVVAGALLTTLALGIPGSATMAIILGAFLMLGLQPGPGMLTTHLELSLTLILVVAVANMIATTIALFAAPYLARVATVSAAILVPVVLLLVFIGTFVNRQLVNDLIVLLIFGALGLAIRNFGYNTPALFLGYVLGGLFEHYFFFALGTAGPFFFLRPISLGLILVMIAVMCLHPIRNMVKRWSKRGIEQT